MLTKDLADNQLFLSSNLQNVNRNTWIIWLESEMQSQLLETQLNPPLEASLLLTLEKEGWSSVIILPFKDQL